MLRCVIRRQCWHASQRHCANAEGLRPVLAAFQSFRGRRSISTAHAAYEIASQSSRRQFNVFQRLSWPAEDEQSEPATWASLLESGLPNYLRETESTESQQSLSPSEIGEILLAAQRLRYPINGIDVLFHLGIERERWSAVVWLVKHLVEYFGTKGLHGSPSSDQVFIWNSENSLREITRGAVDYQHFASHRSAGPDSPSIEELTTRSAARNAALASNFRREVLGQIWRSLGNMTIACADGEIKPELLEIIAYLHHMEIMPITIYSQKPSADATAIQQPPTLGLLSSRILASLSDAAWRARERLAVEEAKIQSGKSASLGPELPGQSYRINVPGLRPEIWLELILWSSLHGGWIFEGARILQTLCSEPNERQWRPLSWRQLVPDDGDGSLDWDNIQFVFNTRPPSSMDPAESILDVPVQRTVSSEIVNAYVDALLGEIQSGVGSSGIPPKFVLNRFTDFQRFLKRSQMSLGAGSWDAVILRFLEARTGFADHPQNFKELVELSPIMGADLDLYTTRDLPAYVLDGSAAIIGLFHRALRSRIKAGDVKGAFKLFSSLQAHADENKRQSVLDFLQKQQLFGQKPDQRQDDLFTSNFSGIDYPAFDMQIPPTILGPFLELVTDARAHDLGRWLLYSDEVDGPIIPERQYGDSAIAPALVRFAAETNDTALLSKVIKKYATNKTDRGPNVPKRVLQSFFESQVSAHRWDVAVRILRNMQEQLQSNWDPVCLAHVARVMMVKAIRVTSKDEESQTDQDSKTDRNSQAGKDSYADFDSAKELFVHMYEGNYENGDRAPDERGQIVAIATILSVVDPLWANFISAFAEAPRYLTFTLPAQSFNRLLESVVEAHGSARGQHLLDLFWPQRVRQAQRAGRRRSTNESRLAGPKPNILDSVQRTRSLIHIGGESPRELYMYGGLQPDLMTVRIILRKALEEFSQTNPVNEEEVIVSAEDASSSETEPADMRHATGDSSVEKTDNATHTELSASEVIAWAMRSLHSLQMADEEIHDELTGLLPERGMESFREELSKFFEHPGNTDSPGG